MLTKQLNIRLSPDDLAIMARLRERLGLDPSAIMRLAIRQLAKHHRVSLKNLSPTTPPR